MHASSRFCFHSNFCRFLSAAIFAVAGTAGGFAAETDALTVEELAAEVLAANPELAIYEGEIEAARGQRTQAGRWANPEFTLEAGHKRIRESGGAGAGEGMMWAASVAQPIEFPGRMELRKAIADRNVELAEIGLEHFRALLTSRVWNLAGALYAARARVEAIEAIASRTEELTEAILQRETGGVSPLLERRILEGSVLALRQRHLEARRGYQEALIELNQLRDVPAETPIRVEEPELDFPDLPPIGELVSRVWTHAFEARAREVELEQQGFLVRLARKDRYPSITVAPFVSQETGGERETVAGIGVTFPLPLWDRNTGNMAAAEARLSQAEAGLLVMRRELERKVVGRALAYQAATETLEALRPAALGEFEEAASLAERHYRLGAIPISTFLEMQNAHLDALEALLETRQQALESRLELELLTGKFGEKEESDER